MSSRIDEGSRLDLRIAQIEARLVAGQDRVQQRALALTQRMQHAVAPWRRALPTLGLLLSVVAIWRLLRSGLPCADGKVRPRRLWGPILGLFALLIRR